MSATDTDLHFCASVLERDHDRFDPPDPHLLRKQKAGLSIWPVSLLARHAPSDQLLRAGHGFQTLSKLRVRTLRD